MPLYCDMPDLIPEGFIPLTEVLDRYQSWLWDGPSPQTDVLEFARLDRLPPTIAGQHRTAVINITDLVLSELVVPFSTGELEALVRPPDSSVNFAIPSSGWREAFFPERLFLSDVIAPAHGGHFDAAAGRSPFARKTDIDRFLGRAPSRDRKRSATPRSVATLSDVLLHLVMDGALTSAEAESLAAKSGMPPFASHPDDDKFDPATEATWSLPMTISWIVWRTIPDVRRAWAEYREGSWEWFDARRNLPLEGGREWYLADGEELRTLPPISLVELGLLEALRADSNEGGKLVSVKTAREDLWRRLGEGELFASALGPGGMPTLIPEHEWPYLQIAARSMDRTYRDYLTLKSAPFSHPYTQLAFKRREVMRIWPGLADKRDHDVGRPADVPLATAGGGKRDAVRAALAALYPGGLPPGLSVKDRLRAINDWLEAEGSSRVSLATVTRALKRR